MEGLTLVPDLHAKAGHRFTFLGPNPGDECDGCPVQKLCFNLDPGSHYEVTEVRSALHPCNLHEGKMRAVKVEPATVETSMDVRRLRGTAATFSAIDCGYPECANWKLCHPPIASRRYEVTHVGAKLDCPMGHTIQRVTLR